MAVNKPKALHLLSTAFTEIPFNHMLGLKLDHLGENHVIMNFSMKNDLIGNFMHGILHGGVISSVLDMAGGMLVMATTIEKHPDASLEELGELVTKCRTVDLHVSYLNPGKGERFYAKSWLVKRGNTVSFTRMELLNQEDALIATATGTYMLR